MRVRIRVSHLVLGLVLVLVSVVMREFLFSTVLSITLLWTWTSANFL